MTLVTRGGSLTIEAYTNVDYTGSMSDKRSTWEYCIFLCSNLVALRSKKQTVVAQSRIEAKFRSMTLGICELL